MIKLLRLVAWFEVLTGVFMIGDAALTLFSSSGNSAVGLSKGILIALGTLGLIAGIALFRPSAIAWRASVVLQVLLIPVFLIGTILFRPGLGVFIPFGVNMPGTGSASALYEFTLGVDFAVSLRADHGQPYVAVNLAALACLVILILNRHVAGKRV